jgi:hypothetical protein
MDDNINHMDDKISMDEILRFNNDDEKEKFTTMLRSLDAGPLERLLYYINYPDYFIQVLWSSISTFSWKL